MTTDTSITPELRNAIGVDMPQGVYEIEKGAIIRFAEAIGDPNPLFTDERAARKSRYGGLIAPPTFLRSLEPPLPREYLPIPHPEVLDGGSEWEFHEPVRPGDRIAVSTCLVDLKERQGKLGTMLFTVRETRYVNQLGDLAALQRSTYIYYTPGKPG